MPNTLPQSLPQAALDALARRLLRHFLAEDGNRTRAFAAALEALLAYHPETLTDALAAARLIALSFATLIASDKAADPDLAERQQLHYLTKTNTLCRTAQKAEAALTRPRPPTTSQTAYRTTATQPAAETTTPTTAQPAPRYPTEPEADAIFNAVMAEIRATRPTGPDPRSDAFWTALQQCADSHAPQPAATPAQPPATRPPGSR